METLAAVLIIIAVIGSLLRLWDIIPMGATLKLYLKILTIAVGLVCLYARYTGGPILLR